MKRELLLNTLITFAFLVVLVRLGGIMVFDHGRYAAEALGQYDRERPLAVKMGTIYDRKGRELAMNLDMESLWCNPCQVASAKDVALAVSDVSSITGLPQAEIMQKLDGPEREKRFAWIKRKLMPAGQGGAIKNITGFGLKEETERFYPNGTLASHVIGYVDAADDGMDGVERSYQSTLKSKGGRVVVQRDATGKILSQGVEMDPGGSSLVLTIDEDLQYIAESALEKAMAKWNAQSGSVIMMDPYNGEILAMANKPDFNPNDPGKTGPRTWKNRAIMDAYEPGSVFKLVTGSAGLETGVVTPNSMFNTGPGYIEVGGRKFHDDDKLGVISFAELYQKSSNVGAITIGLKLGPEKLYEYAKKFGFGQKTGIDLPFEASGYLRKPSTLVSLASNSIGYGVAVTPIQLLRAYSAVANGGYLPNPHVVQKIISPEGQVISSFTDFKGPQVIKPETARILRRILRGVTQQGGTATEAAVDGNEVSGKTGTARLYDPRTHGYSGLYASTFVGFVPSHDPKIAMVVVIKGAKGPTLAFGGLVSGPVFSEIADRALAYLDVPRDDGIQNNLVYLGDKEDLNHETAFDPGRNKN